MGVFLGVQISPYCSGPVNYEQSRLISPWERSKKLMTTRDTINRLQAFQCNSLQNSILKVARRVARFLHPLRTIGAFSDIRYSRALCSSHLRENSLNFTGLKIKYRRSNNPLKHKICVSATRSKISRVRRIDGKIHHQITQFLRL